MGKYVFPFFGEPSWIDINICYLLDYWVYLGLHFALLYSLKGLRFNF